MARSSATWHNPSRKMMDLLDERAPSPSAVEVDAGVEGVEFVVRADLPGIDPDRDLSLRVSSGRLLMSGDRPADVTNTGPHERRRGWFTREVSLPPTASSEAAVTYVDGVLEVRIPLGARTAPTALAVRHPVHDGAPRRGQRTPVRRATVPSGSTVPSGPLVPSNAAGLAKR